MGMSKWAEHPLDDLLDDVLDRRGVTPLKLGSDLCDEGHRVISAKLVKEGRIDLTADEPRFVDQDTYARWMKTPLLPDDVIVTSEAPLGQVAYISEELDWCLGQRLFALRPRKERLLGRYLYYALQYANVVSDIQSRATGTTAQGIRQSELRKVQLPTPPLEDQRAIAHILGTLDDKIELNRRMNETLEAMARAIFKSWFVDFDPVRAKASGERPESICRRLGLTPDVLALFGGAHGVRHPQDIRRLEQRPLAAAFLVRQGRTGTNSARTAHGGFVAGSRHRQATGKIRTCFQWLEPSGAADRRNRGY